MFYLLICLDLRRILKISHDSNNLLTSLLFSALSLHPPSTSGTDSEQQDHSIQNQVHQRYEFLLSMNEDPTFQPFVSPTFKTRSLSNSTFSYLSNCSACSLVFSLISSTSFFNSVSSFS